MEKLNNQSRWNVRKLLKIRDALQKIGCLTKIDLFSIYLSVKKTLFGGELKAVGLKKASAHAIGIAVDHRRRNRSIESLQTNVQRLKEYQANMILFPLNPKKPRKGDATPEEISKATQLV